MKTISLQKSGVQTALTSVSERVRKLYSVATVDRTLWVVASVGLTLFIFLSAKAAAAGANFDIRTAATLMVAMASVVTIDNRSRKGGDR